MTRVYLQDTELTGGTGSNISAEDLRKYFEPYRDVDFFKTSNNCTIVNNFSRTWGPIVSIDYTFKFNANFSWPNPTASTWQGYAPGVSKERDCPQSIATLHVWDVSTVHHIGFAFLNISGSIVVDIPVSQIPTDHTYRINGVYMRRANYR